MANCYKNFPVTITYSDSTSDAIYSNSTSLSENVELQRAESLGVKGSNAVFNTQVSQGSVGVDSYLNQDLTNFNNLKGSNDQNIVLTFGPYTAPKPCILSSMSLDIGVGEPITVSRSFDYFGSVTEGVFPSVAEPTLSAATPQGITLSGYDGIGGSNIISNISWSFSQSYEQIYLLGDTTPTIVFRDGEIELSIEGENFTNSLMKSASEGCVVPPKEYNIVISGCNGANLGTLTLTGYMTSRSSSVEARSIERDSVSIIQYL